MKVALKLQKGPGDMGALRLEPRFPAWQSQVLTLAMLPFFAPSHKTR